ncbi:hypothetical protein BE04_24690, partial [Sorangium cellulosum]
MRAASSPPGVDGVIVGVGARSASGLTALQVTMSARAHKFAPRESHLVDKRGENIATARLMTIGDDVFGLDRFVALGGPALTQAAFPWLASWRDHGAAPPLPAVIALPSESRPGFDPRLRRYLLEALEARARVPLDRARSRLIFHCRGGGVMAFEHAVNELLARGCAAVVVGGIDSYFDPDVLEHLDAGFRLHGAETENGFIPGEGAAFVVLVPRTEARGLARYGRVLAAVSEGEPRPFGSEEPCLAYGMTLALKRALAAVSAEARPISWMLTDVANERHRVDEWTTAAARAHRGFTADVLHDQPLLKTGDVGAASASMLLAMAATRWRTGCAAGDTAL